MSKMIYVAGPLRAPTPEARMANIQAAIRVGIAVYEAGHYPFIPSPKPLDRSRASEAQGKVLQHP